MAKKLTFVLVVSDDTADEVSTWVDDHNRTLMFMGQPVQVLELSVNDAPAPTEHDAKFLPGSREAAEYLGTSHWRDSQGNVHWLDGRELQQP